jgi:hypothetical protein
VPVAAPAFHPRESGIQSSNFATSADDPTAFIPAKAEIQP